MALVPPVSVRSPQEFRQVVETQNQQPPEAPSQPPAAEPAPEVPGTRDTVETTEEARQRAGQDAALGAMTPQQRGVDAARTFQEVRDGIETRNVRLSRANDQVRGLEQRLGEQLMHLAPSMAQPERQAYADAYRQRNAGPYTEARGAANDLASYTRDNLHRLEQAGPELRNHPYRGAVADQPMRAQQAMRESMRQLDTAVSQSPTGDPQLQRTLGELGQRYSDVARRAGEPNADPGNRQRPGADPVRPGVGATGFALNQLGQDAAALARRASGAFGAAGGALGAADNVGRIVNGTARTEHIAGAAVNGVQIAGGLMRVAGVAIGGPISLAATIGSVGLGAVSSIRDGQQYRRDVTDTLRQAGVDPARAEALARSNPAALRRLEQAGYTPQQVSDLAANAPSTVRMHESQTAPLTHGLQRFGLDPAQTTDLVRQLGPQQADLALNSLQRIIGANPGVDNAFIMRSLQQGSEANDYSRSLARLLQARQ